MARAPDFAILCQPQGGDRDQLGYLAKVLGGGCEYLDAALISAIDECEQFWRDSPASTIRVPTLASLRRRRSSQSAISRACRPTVEGYHAKIERIRKADFEDSALLGVMFLLGPDAERIGITDEPPDLRRTGEGQFSTPPAAHCPERVSIPPGLVKVSLGALCNYFTCCLTTLR
jgi:hypothetical protein